MITGSIDDAGRNESGLKEKNDCTVRAYALMKGITYIEAYGVFYLAGRIPRRRTSVHETIYNREFIKLNRPNMTVKTFIENIAIKGNWIIQIRGHVFAVINKEIKDINPMSNINRHVVAAWMIKA